MREEPYCRTIKKQILVYIFDIEDSRMYPIVNTGMSERNAIDLPPIRSPSCSLHAVPGNGDIAEIEVFATNQPARIIKITGGTA